jgi:hypothetical protein
MRRTNTLFATVAVVVAALGLEPAFAQQAGMKRATPSVEQLKAIPHGEVRLLPSEFARRRELNRSYVNSLTNQNLLQNFYMEAGLWNPRMRNTAMGGPVPTTGEDIHWGWESPTCQLRGHFLGHWMSAAAFLAASTNDIELKARAEKIVSELARVQERNGGQWVASIPEKYLHWIAEGVPVWAPHYTIHKTFMGLVDVHKHTGNRQALEVANNFARWFHNWTKGFTREQMDDILDVETGGMLEAFADLYGLTGDPMYKELMERYDRPRLFHPLLQGLDPLTNRHANTTIPEAHGAARAYEVTGEKRWLDIVKAYWDSAVTKRGAFCTGGQTSGEIWTPPHQLAARLGEKTQEHCTVYNMIRLADYLFRWTGDIQYADYIERNIYNGILPQQNPKTGMIAYFLPLEAGGKKVWGTPTSDFWCCHGTLVQAHTRHDRYIYYQEAGGIVVAQYIPSEVTWEQGGARVKLSQRFDRQTRGYGSLAVQDPIQRPNHWAIDFEVETDKPADFALRLRLPWWLAGEAELLVNGQKQAIASKPSTFVTLKRTWKKDTLRLVLPKKLTTEPLPDRPEMVAFMDGPVVLAGIVGEERTLIGDRNRPESILVPDNEREWAVWLNGYRTVGQSVNIRFVPLTEIVDEAYTVYFPVRSP